MWILVMNDMRFAHVEQLEPVCWASSLEEIDQFLASELVEVLRAQLGDATAVNLAGVEEDLKEVSPADGEERIAT